MIWEILPIPKNPVTHQQTEINKPEENVHPPASYIACRCLYIRQTGSPIIGSHRTMRHTCGWWSRKRHDACDFPPSPVPVLHAAVMGNEPAPAFLKRKHKTEFNQEVNNELQGKSTSHSPVSHPCKGRRLVCLNSGCWKRELKLSCCNSCCYWYEIGGISLIRCTEGRRDYLFNNNEQW